MWPNTSPPHQSRGRPQIATSKKVLCTDQIFYLYQFYYLAPIYFMILTFLLGSLSRRSTYLERGGGQSSQGSEEGGEGWEPKGAVTRASLIDRWERGKLLVHTKKYLLFFNANLCIYYSNANLDIILALTYSVAGPYYSIVHFYVLQITMRKIGLAVT